MNDYTNQSKPTKILIMGLDNSGKTSILLSLRENANLLSYISLKPTKGLVVEEFDSHEQKLVCWDLGGQAQYRKGYLKEFSKYTKETTKIIYVIDIQDKKRYDLSLEYLDSFIELLKKNTGLKDLEISIFLHKYDPDLKEIKVESVNIFKEKIQEKLDNTDFFYQIFRTSIYAIFEKIVID